ncbi:hypothetical protein [Herpetosiphon gulosus]|uniref:4-vinyl reductase 4VR domain-containing protein n=1 Tax=Herpetosiphon gulosus TaxID=1973496 RepID=A0ABP9WWX2_9CHLR
MYRFARSAPLAVEEFADPGINHREGAPLSLGSAYLMLGMVAADECPPEILNVLDQLNPEKWYHGQLFETMINYFEDRDPALMMEIGRGIYYSLAVQFREMGLNTPTSMLVAMPDVWRTATRGASGEWRTTIVAAYHARVEVQQPYNCMFEQAAMEGVLQGLGARDVRITHEPCMRDGHAYCVFDIRWTEL